MARLTVNRAYMSMAPQELEDSASRYATDAITIPKVRWPYISKGHRFIGKACPS